MTVRMAALTFFVSVAAFVIGCGGGSPEAPPPPAAGGGDGGPGELDGAVLWTEGACDACHGADGSGGAGPDVRCYGPDGLLAYLTPTDTPHAGGARAAMTAAEAAALATFLGESTCASGVPASHTVPMGAMAVLHRAGFDTPETSCVPCHGTDLGGSGSVPSCASCHGPTGESSCTTCHASPQDNADGVPVGGRRAVVGEFALTSHHVGSAITDADCVVCHVTDAHRSGVVRLRDVDGGAVIALTASPFTSTEDAERLEAFCLACHDADGADGHAPFSNGVMPVAVDTTAWAASAHAMAPLTCAGNGTTIGCHASGHGTGETALLADAYVVADPHARSDGDYQACWNCHAKNTILFGNDAFDEYHKKHVIDEDTACATCHGIHGSYDASERGLIDLTWALNDGAVTLPSGTTLGSAFTTTTGGGACMLTCHGETHNPENYPDD